MADYFIVTVDEHIPVHVEVMFEVGEEAKVGIKAEACGSDMGMQDSEKCVVV